MSKSSWQNSPTDFVNCLSELHNVSLLYTAQLLYLTLLYMLIYKLILIDRFVANFAARDFSVWWSNECRQFTYNNSWRDAIVNGGDVAEVKSRQENVKTGYDFNGCFTFHIFLLPAG